MCRHFQRQLKSGNVGSSKSPKKNDRAIRAAALDDLLSVNIQLGLEDYTTWNNSKLD